MRNPISSLPLLIFIGVVLIYPALQRQIRVGLWHLWNGNTTRLQEYDIPVPMSWIADQPAGGTVALVEIGTDHTRDLVDPVIFMEKTTAPQDLNFASTLKAFQNASHEQFLESEGVQIFERRTIEFDAEKADCIVSNEYIGRSIKEGLPIPIDKVISITCESTDLSIHFTGNKEYVDTFFSIVSQIRKHKDRQN